MKKFTFPCEDPILSKYIDNYTILEFDDSYEEPVVMVPPLGFPVIQFQFGVESNFYNQDHLRVNSILCGQMTRHLILRPVSGTKLVGVDFKPYGIYNLFGIKLYELIDSAVPGSDLFMQKSIDQLIDNLKQADDYNIVIDLVANFLLTKISQVKVKPPSIYDPLIDRIIDANGLIDLSGLLGNKVHIRNFQRYFKTHIGISPKQFMQVLRHKFVLQCLFEDASFNWKDPRLDGYYYDQSHFDRDFIKFSKQRPMEYLRINHIMAKKLV